MNVALWLLATLGVIGAFDTLYYHEWRARLPAQGSLAAPEEITVCRLLNDRRTHDLIYRPDILGTFVFQATLER